MKNAASEPDPLIRHDWFEASLQLPARTLNLLDEVSAYIDRITTLTLPGNFEHLNLNVDIQQYVSRVTSCKSRLLVKMADNVINLAVPEERAGRPDRLGAAFTRAVDAANSALIENDLQKYEQLIRTVVLSALVIPPAINAEFSKTEIVQRTKLSVDPILDTQTICGLAYLYSEIHGTDFISPTEQAWDVAVDGMFTGSDPSFPFMERVAFTIFCNEDIAAGMPSLSSHGLLRTGWKIKIEQVAVEAGLGQDFDPFRGKPNVIKGKERAQYATRSGMPMFTDPINIFLAEYFVNKKTLLEPSELRRIDEYIEGLKRWKRG